MIWYKFHLGDYIAHTYHLSDAEDLAYRRLLDMYYMTERMIPLDIGLVSRKIRLDTDITESVLSEFFERTNDGYQHQRCETEISKYQHQVEVNRGLGKRGGRPKMAEPETKPVAELAAEPVAPKKAPPKIAKIAPPPSRFDEFWAVWPPSKRKVGRSAVESKWARHHLDEVADAILTNVQDLKCTEQWLSGYEPAPLTYINQRRWEDAGSTESAVTQGRRVI